jgi:DNA mismatch repair protein MutL
LAVKKPLSAQRILRGSRETPDEKNADTASSHSAGAALDGAASDNVNPMADDAVDHAEPAAPPQSDPIVKHPVPALQMHNRYLVVESEEGVVVIDQHALHERILYEHLRENVLDGELETQNLLVPEPVDLTPAEAVIVLEHTELLGKLGLKIEPFGGETVLLSSYPAMLANLKPIEVLRGLVEQLVGDKTPDRRDLLDEMLHSIACKAAIKAGDRLTPAEVAALLEQRHLVHDAHHCPHGRPTALVFTREELDRQFMRT